MTPYYSDELVTLYLGDSREIVPALGVAADCIVTDPPYESTSLAWDKWPDGWLEVAAQISRSMWCFLPRRQFVEPPFRGQEFHAAGWKFSQPAVWEKHNGSGFANDRLKLVHEEIGHWYRGRWADIYHEVPRCRASGPRVNGRQAEGSGSGQHLGEFRRQAYRDDGTRLIRSVIKARSMQGRAIHRTEKPVPLLLPLIEYACPAGGLVVDLFAGSGSTLEAARHLGRHAVGVEIDEVQAEKIARRLALAPESPAPVPAVPPAGLALFDLPSANPAA